MNSDSLSLIKQSIKTIPDYPKAGILFRDVTSLLEDPVAYQLSIRLLVDHYKDHGFTKLSVPKPVVSSLVPLWRWSWVWALFPCVSPASCQEKP